MRAALAAGSGGLAGLLALRYIWFARAALPEPVQHGTLTAPAEPEIAADHVRRGHRRLIIVAHGFLKSMNWRPQVAMVREAAQRFDVLCFDFPGHGRSGGWAISAIRLRLPRCAACAIMPQALGTTPSGWWDTRWAPRRL